MAYGIIRLWIDDLQPDPDTEWRDIAVDTLGWVWVKTSADAIEFLESALSDQAAHLEEVSFDYDLRGIYGSRDNSLAVMTWITEHNFWPSRISIHTTHVIGRKLLLSMAESNAPKSVVIS